MAVIGTGYVGLVAGACFAEMGNKVQCVDIDEEKISKLKSGIIPIYEPGLEPIVKKNYKDGRLKFTTNLGEAVKASEIIFVAVGTPPKTSGEADLFYVERVAREIAANANGYKIVVEKSTVPVQTGEKIAETLKKYSNSAEFDVVSNPEFLREGSAVKDFMEPDRIVIGTDSDRAFAKMVELYKPLNSRIIRTDIKSAEIIKHASNSFLATKISFINAVARICELANADVEKVAEGMGADARIGKQFLNAGVGYGGSCFPKDVQAFIDISSKLGYDFNMLREVEKINKHQRTAFLKKIEGALWVVKGKTIGVLGLAFKPNTDDMREAPAIDIIKGLQEEGAHVKAYDPEAMENAKKLLKGVEYCSSPYEVAKGVDLLIIVTEWDEFKKMDLNKIKSAMAHPTIADGRNIFDPKEMYKKGFNYISMGR